VAIGVVAALGCVLGGAGVAESKPSAEPGWAVPVVARETAGVRRSDWPLTINVPLPRGVLRQGQPLTVTQSGKPLPSQSSVLAAWPDGSVRWAEVDSRVSLRPGEEASLAVVAAAPPSNRRPLRIEETKKAIAVDTGAIRFSIPKDRFAIAAAIAIGSLDPTVAAVGSSMVVDGRVHAAGAPTSIVVEDKGPLRGSVALRGPFGSDFEYRTQIEFDAGSPLIRVRHTFVKTGGAAQSRLERLSVDLALGDELAGDYSAGLEGAKPLTGEIGEAAVVLQQTDSETLRRGSDDSEGRLAGWFEISGRHRAVGIAGRWFWQEYPKAASLSSRGITYDLWSPAGGVASIGIGVAKTHELVLWLAKRGTIGKAAAPAVARRLRGFIDPEWTARSGALRGALAPSASDLDEKLVAAAERYRNRNARERWDDCGAVRCVGDANARPRDGAFGMLNWGDWNFPGYRDTVKGTDAWGNLEYDATQVLALAYAASNDERVFDDMVAAARHFGDVDVIHALPERAEWVGMNHPKNPLHFTFELGGIDLGHTWTEGLVSAYLLSGERRALESARGIADYLVRRSRDVLRGNPRQWGWPVIALLGVYDVVREPRYLEAAQWYARRGMRAHPPAAKLSWKLGILADGLALLRDYAPSAEIDAWLRAYAGAVVGAGKRDIRYHPGVAYAGWLASDEAWRNVAQRRLDAIDLGNWGKPFSINGRAALRIVDALRRPPPPTTSPPR